MKWAQKLEAAAVLRRGVRCMARGGNRRVNGHPSLLSGAGSAQ